LDLEGFVLKSNQKDSFELKTFRIEGLFGDLNVSIDFTDNIRILVGENGVGKTTILTLLYYTLSRNFNKLREIDFKSIELHFWPEKLVTIRKEWLEINHHPEIERIQDRLKHWLTSNEYDYVKKYILTGKEDIISFREQFETDIRKRNLPFTHIMSRISQLKKLFESNEVYVEFNESIENVDKLLDSLVKSEILYFPTYRRIEEDLSKLGLDNRWRITESLDNVFSNGIIQFGMKDVDKLFNNIKTEIKDQSLNSYSKVTSNMIKHLIHRTDSITEEMVESINDNKETLKIVLDRFGKNLEEIDKTYIFQLIENDELISGKYDSLVYFLYSLIKDYNAIREKDDAIKKFKDVCNKYLINKEIIYNESEVEILIKNINSGKTIELSDLSSGEKQIISIFSRIYLSKSKDFIVLFDEPELSLSIDWQEKLLPDIFNSGKCKLLMAVTHSPFIFNNELDKYAEGIGSFIEELKSGDIQ
jgi:predicted ATPase